jgi:hypothetical protein
MGKALRLVNDARPARSPNELETIPVTAERTLRVLGVRDDDADQPPVLVVQDLA